MPVHATHPDIINRLKRAKGHLETVLQMIEAGRACTELAQQLHAVEKAVGQAKRTLIQDHLDHCLDEAVVHSKAGRETVDQFKQISKYL